MKSKIRENNFFKQSALFRFIIILMAILHVVYVSIAIYKSHISKPLLGQSHITKGEYSQLENLTNYTTFLEIVFILLILIGTFLIFTNKHKRLFNSYFVIQLTFLIAIAILNRVLAWIFDAPAGDLSQNLIIPFIIMFFVLMYFIIRRLFFRGKVEE